MENENKNEVEALCPKRKIEPGQKIIELPLLNLFVPVHVIPAHENAGTQDSLLGANDKTSTLRRRPHCHPFTQTKRNSGLRERQISLHKEKDNFNQCVFT